MAKDRKYPSGVSIAKSKNGAGRLYWRVRLGKRFTGGPIIKRDFGSEQEAEKWLNGDGGEIRLNLCSMSELKKVSGEAAFLLKPKQLREAAWAFEKLGDTSLTEAVQFYLAHTSRRENPPR